MPAVEAIAEALKVMGFGLAGLAIATAAAGLILQLILIVAGRDIPRNLSFLGFRSSLVAMIGVQIAILGMIIEGRLPWPFLLSLLIFGMPAVVALRAPLDFPGLPTSRRGR